MIMALGASFNVLVLVLASWVSEPVYGQGCSVSPQEIVTSASTIVTITSPGYPSHYTYDLECTWRIQADLSGDIVKVTFNDFHVGRDSFGLCGRDELDFYDGNITASNLLGPYCGTVHPEVIYSTGRYLFVKFSSDDLSNYKGFSLNVTAAAKEEAAGICRKTSGGSNNDVMQLGGPSGTIFSPGYPFPYPRDSKCTWVISVPIGNGVKLTFQDFSLGIGFTPCKSHSSGDEDFVEIRDGKDSESDELARYCDYNYNIKRRLRDIYSTGNHMRITFSSSSSLNVERGFKARYEELSSASYSKEKCSYGNVNNEKLSLNGTYGTLESPKEGSSYPPNMRCDWLITVPEGKIVKLSFDEFQLETEYAGSCSRDYVRVRDGKESYSASKGTFCGLKTPADIRSSGRYMRVSFRSDSYSSYYDGFKATFIAEEKGVSSLVIVAVTIGSIVFVCILVCIVKCRRTRRNQSAAARIPLATQTTAPVSQTIQEGVIHHPPPPQQPAGQPPFQTASNPYPPPPVFAPAQSNAYPPPSGYPYPLLPPPPYPGEEQVPQYPPPGQSYPWQQSA